MTQLIAIKAVLPKRKFLTPRDFKRMVRQAADATRPAVEADLQQISASWSRPIRWSVRIAYVGRDVELRFSTRDARYAWLNYGTGAQGNKSAAGYIITPINARFLRFQAGYAPLTQPGQLQSTGVGGPFGETVFTKRVEHHGIEARRWSDIIMKRHRNRFGREFHRIFRAWL